MKKVIFFILLLFITIKVNADQKAYVNYEPIENVYSNQGGYSVKGMYMSHLGKPVYCIKPGYPLSYNGYNTYYLSTIDELTDKQKQDIELIMYYGYLYDDHNSIYYYMATQELVWNIIGQEVYWSTERNGNGNIIDISEFKNKILNLFNSHFIRPKFNENNDYEVGKEIILEDTNNVLKDYFLMYYGLNSVSKSENKLSIKLYELGYDRIILERNFGYYEESTVFKEDGYQSLMKLGGIMGDFYSIEFDVHETSMNINRIDSNTNTNIPSGSATLKDAIYDIYDENNNLIDTVTTDENGIAIVNNLSLKNYIIKEVTPSKGYIPNSYPIGISIGYGNTPKTTYIESDVINKNIDITNIYKQNDVLYYEEGIMFEIYKDESLIKTITTDINGKCNTDLDYGIYKIKQINTKEGYDKVNDFEVIIDEEERNLHFTFITEKNTEETNVDNEQDIEEEDNIENNNNDSSNNTEVDNDNLEENNNELSNEIEELPQLLEYNQNKTYYIFILLIVFICIKKYCLS